MIEPYRIGWRTRPSRWHRWGTVHRPWQAEAEGERFARRAFTPAGAHRKMRRDVAWRKRTGRRSFHQWRRWLVAPGPPDFGVKT